MNGKIKRQSMFGSQIPGHILLYSLVSVNLQGKILLYTVKGRIIKQLRSYLKGDWIYIAVEVLMLAWVNKTRFVFII